MAPDRLRAEEMEAYLRVSVTTGLCDCVYMKDPLPSPPLPSPLLPSLPFPSSSSLEHPVLSNELEHTHNGSVSEIAVRR